MLLSFMELLEPKKTAQPQEQDPKDDLLGHRRTQAATIEPKPRPRCRWLWLKGGRIGVESKFFNFCSRWNLEVICYRGPRRLSDDALIEGCGNEESLPYMILIARIICLAAAVSYTMILHAIQRRTTQNLRDQRADIRSSQGRDYARAHRLDWRWNHLLLSRTSPPCSAGTGRPGNGQTIGPNISSRGR
jgi:hypothetical protein